MQSSNIKERKCGEDIYHICNVKLTNTVHSREV